MKKSMLFAIGALYASLSLGANPSQPISFLTKDWTLITSSYVSDEPSQASCAYQDGAYKCFAHNSGTYDGEYHQIQPTFTLTNDNSQFCTYQITATWSAAKLVWIYSNQLTQTTSGIDCAKTETGSVWIVNPA